MSQWKYEMFQAASPDAMAKTIAEWLNSNLSNTHPIYTKVGVGNWSGTTAVLIYLSGQEGTGADSPGLPSIYSDCRWVEHQLGRDIEAVLRVLNALDPSEALLARFAFSKEEGVGLTAAAGIYNYFLFVPQGA